MARKVIDISNSASHYNFDLSQTPGNYDKNNYFLKELQDKINSEWDFRPNRADVEYETVWGHQKWAPIEVVIQTNKSEKGVAISDDYKKFVFKDLSESRFRIGSRFRLNRNYDINVEDKQKDAWIVTNFNKASMTANVVVQRCNGILGSMYTDEQNVTRYHYEPVIQGRDLSSVSLFFNETAVSPQSELVITAQYNDFTKNYKLNQRFIIGARQENPDKSVGQPKFIGGQVYRLKAINKSYSGSTFDPEDIGLMIMYLEITETSVYDDWDHMIAYQQDNIVHIDTDTENIGYSIILKTPEVIPQNFTSAELLFTPMVVSDSGTEYPALSSKLIKNITLENCPATLTDASLFINSDVPLVSTAETGVFLLDSTASTFTISRKRMYLNGLMTVSIEIKKEDLPTTVSNDLKISFKLDPRKPE